MSRRPSRALLYGPKMSGKKMCLELGFSCLGGPQDKNMLLSMSSFDDYGIPQQDIEIQDILAQHRSKSATSKSSFRSLQSYPNVKNIREWLAQFYKEILQVSATLQGDNNMKTSQTLEDKSRTSLFLHDFPLKGNT